MIEVEASSAAAPATDPIVSRLTERFGEAIEASSSCHGTLIVTVPRERVREVLGFLREDPILAFGMLLDIATVDWLDYEGGREPRFAIVYNLLSLSHRHRVQVQVAISEDDLVMPTVTDIWVGANWFEREAFDMMGIRFEGHPNPSRILTHPGFKGHPLRKDYEADKRHPIAAPPLTVPHA